MLYAYFKFPINLCCSLYGEFHVLLPFYMSALFIFDINQGRQPAKIISDTNGLFYVFEIKQHIKWSVYPVKPYLGFLGLQTEPAKVNVLDESDTKARGFVANGIREICSVCVCVYKYKSHRDDYLSLDGNRCPKWDHCKAGENGFWCIMFRALLRIVSTRWVAF